MQKRLLAIALALTGTVPSLAHALGLGNIEVYSALNQPLMAEIGLSSVRPGELDNMVVSLADDEAFSRAGVERPFYLTELRFEVATKPDGTEYIKVTSDDRIREPFLNFLVDVDWPRGRLLREYTILLDPPVFATSEDTGAGEAPVSEPAPTGAGAAAGTTAGASAAGEPALIDRETAPAEDEFGYDEPVESGDDGDPSTFSDTYTFGGEDTGDTGFGVEPDAGVETSDLPDIEIAEADDEPGQAGTGTEEDTGAEVFPYDEAGDTGTGADVGAAAGTAAGAADAFSFEDDTAEAETDDAAGFEEFSYEDEAAAEDGETFGFEDEQPADETAAVEPDTATGADDLPEIDLAFDDTLPYDEQATNALMAQFAAEDEADGRAVQRAPETDTADTGTADADEHEVQAGDTLYELANRYKAPDVSVNQAMLALLRYNPDAFIRDNINNVKKGFVLRVPDRESMLEIDSAEALAEVRRQHALWREYRSQLAGAPSTEQDARTSDDMTIAERGAESGGDGELSIVAPGADAEASDRASGAQEGSESGSSLYMDLQLAREELEAERLEKQELQARISELNEQIEKQDRLISVQSEQLAQLQQRLRQLEGQTSLPEVDVAEQEQAADEQDVEDQAAGEQPEEEPIAEPADEEAPAETAAADDDQPAEIRPGLGMTLGGEDKTDGPDTGTGETGPAGDETTGADAEEQAAADIDQELGSTDEPVSLGQQPGAQSEETAGQAADTEQAATAPEPAAPGAATSETQVQPAEPEPRPQPIRPRRPTGIAGYAYDLLPAPYNVMAADALQSPVGLGALGAVALLLLLMLVAALKPTAKKAPKRSAFIEALAQEEEQSDENEEPVDEETTVVSVARKPSLGERLSAMFAPLTGAFGKKDKGGREPAADTFEEADAEPADTGEEDIGEIESFDDTAKAAAAGFAGEASATQTDRSTTGGFAKTTQSAEPPASSSAAEPEEDLSDDTTQEADVYLAYGLHDQAEELLAQALQNNPDNVQYTGKLLETYYAAGKRSEFEALAGKLHESLAGRSSRVWDKAVAMGKELAPDNRLFREADTGGLNVSDFAPAKPETADLDLSEPQGSTTPDIDFGDDEGPASTTTDFDLDLGDADEGGDDALIAGPDEDDDRTQILEARSDSGETELEFDLDVGDDEEVGSELNIDFNAEELGLDGDSESTDLDTGFDADEDSGKSEDIDMDATVAMDLSFNLDDESAESSDSDSGSGSDNEELDAIELDDDLDLGDAADMDATDVDSTDFESESSSAGEDLIADLDYDGGGDDLQEASVDTEFEISDDDDTIIDADLDDETLSGDTNFDEVATKLDLAKAYMDMGDTDGASSTLEEVMAEGSDDQRREAEELLDQIN